METKLILGVMMMAANFCGSLLIETEPHDFCVKYVTDCLLDGEDVNYCSKDYLMHGEAEQLQADSCEEY